MEGRGTQEGRVNYPFTATMSEPAGHSDGLHEIPERTPADASSADAPSLEQNSVADPLAALFDGSIPPTDDAPTVISKQAPRAVSNDEMLAGILRGKTLAHFELLEAVGVGGMAAVLRARDTQLDRIVALKILPPDMAADEENVRRFHQEARSAAKLDHENIARVFFCGEDQKLHFIAFEYVEGENLRTLIDRLGRLPVGEAIHYMLQIAAGLAHAAARSVVHRDIKPSNIVITPNGRAKLVDMGLARSLEPHHDGGLTQSGVTLGTFDYISPEQAIEPREADVRSDIYSLGCTFYHALTGQPPVPDGTAAKKLHHHQQVAPLDPRQLNPDLPDEVAAILARMMAKDPKARYQRAEHLVQHLLGVAQKIGAPSHLPEGVLYVDAALPEPPRVRPLLLAAIGVAAVVALVLVFGSSSWTPGGLGILSERPPSASKEALGAGTPITPANTEPRDQNTAPTVASKGPITQEFESPTLKELADFLANNADKDDFDLAISGDLWLTGNDGEDDRDIGVLAPGKKLTLHASKDAARPPTLHIAYTGAGHFKSARWIGLLLRAEDITLRGLRIVIDAKSADTRLAGLVFQASRLHVSECVFIQVNPSSSDAERTTSVLIDGTRPGMRPQVNIDRSVFLGGKAMAGNMSVESELQEAALGGQDAITVARSANVTVGQCAYGPHAAPIVFEGGDRGSSSLKMKECTAIAASGEWSAFRFAEGASCEPLEVQHCLFARADGDEPSPGPMMMMDQPRKAMAVLVRQAGLGRVRFEGRDNRYYHLDGFWLRAADDLAATSWAEFQTEVQKQGGATEERPGLLAASPWLREKPLDLLQRPDAANNLRDAFRLKDNQRTLRQKEDPSALVGVNRSVWGASYDKLPDLEESHPTAVAGRFLTVDPKAATGGNTFRRLNAALEEATPGDVILIRHDGLLPLNLARLEKSATNVTIKPDAGFHPILTIGDTTEADAALFTLHDGQLTLEGLELRLQPENEKFQAQVLVRMAQDGACTFKDCVITLKEVGRVSLAAVALADPSRAMKMDKDRPEARPERGAGAVPRVKFEHCFVRGEGDLVWVRASRPFDLDCASSLVALNGSLLNVEAGRDDAPAAPAGPAATVKLSRLTAYLGGYLVRLKAGRDLKSLIPIHCKGVADCLFVAANKKTTLIHLDGPNSTEDRMKALVQWDGGNHNAYSDFDNLLDQQPEDPSFMPDAPYGQDKWKTFTGETDGKFGSVKFADAPAVDNLAQTKPLSFKLRDPDPQAPGVEKIDELPRPANPDS